jgi:hypothetical protein
MSDEIDVAQQREMEDTSKAVAAARGAAARIPEGDAGVCELCEEWNGRLVEGVCSPCRDDPAMRRYL